MKLVGIFFYIDGEIIIDAVPVEHGEPYGNAVQHGGHYVFWETLVPKCLAERKLKARAYDAYPRGRLVFIVKRKVFRLFADRCLSPEVLDLIKEQFGLSKVEIMVDEHYQCAGCNPYYSD